MAKRTRTKKRRQLSLFSDDEQSVLQSEPIHWCIPGVCPDISVIIIDEYLDKCDCELLEIAAWLRPYPSNKLRDVLADRAARLGSLSLLKWAYDNGCEIRASACTEAAKRGDLAMLGWLCSYPSHITRTVMPCTVAAARGAWATVRWLHVNMFPWDYMTSYYAERSEDLEMMQWLRLNRCPFPMDARQRLAQSNNVDVRAWAQNSFGFN